MTNEQLADLVCGPHHRTISVSMSKDGVVLRVGMEHHDITTEQAELVLLAMQEMMTPSLPRPSQNSEAK